MSAIWTRAWVWLKKERKWTDWLIAIFTAVIAATSYLQWREIRSGSFDTHTLAEAAKKQADAALLNLRAWIAVKDTRFNYFTDKQGIPRAGARLQLTNTGPSPGFGLQIWLCGQIRLDEPSVDIFPTEGQNCIIDEIGMIGKDIPITFNIPEPSQAVPKNSLAASSFEKGPHYYVWGKITYDIYPKDRRHFTSVCFLNGTDQLAPCSKGNNAD